MIPPPKARYSSRNGESSPTITHPRSRQVKFCSPVPPSSTALLPPTSREPEFHPFASIMCPRGRNACWGSRGMPASELPCSISSPAGKAIPTPEPARLSAPRSDFRLCRQGALSLCLYFSQG